MRLVRTLADEFAYRKESAYIKSLNGKVTIVYSPPEKTSYALKQPLLSYNAYKHFTYPKSFNAHLKSIILTRDNYQCRLCYSNQGELHVHHINCDKRDSALLNLITLCEPCHDKTYHHRQYWYDKLWNMMHP